MKAVINKKTLITIGLLTLGSIGFAQIPLAKNADRSAIEFKFIGTLESHPLFRLSLKNDEKEDYLINVRDENNDVLYSEVLKGGNLTRRYELDINDADIDLYRFKVTFEITSRKTHKTTIYNITKKVQEVEDILVAKL